MSDTIRPSYAQQVVELRQQLAEAEELHRMQLAAVTAAAVGNTRSTARERIARDNPYWTAVYHDVCNAVDREMTHREKLAEAREELGKALTWQPLVELRTKRAEAAESKLAEAEATLKNPEKWMLWCDLKMLERCEAAEAEIARLKEKNEEWHKQHTAALQLHIEAENELSALTTALSALVENWKQSAESLRLRKGQMTREKRSHEVLANCAYDLTALLDSLKEGK